MKRQQYFYLLAGLVLGLVMNIAATDHKKTAAPISAQPPLAATATIKAQKTAYIPPLKTLLLPSGGKTVHLPILMYHHIGDLPANPDTTRKDLTVPTQNFQQQIQWLSLNGYQTITLSDLYLYSLGKFKMPLKPVVLTFDDGYSDAFQNALPILKQFGFVGSFEIITDNPGQIQGTNSYASWSNITAAQNTGNEIVCHTENHFDGSNPKFASDYIYQNLSGCKQTLASHNIFTNILVYPYGHYTADYIIQAQKAGFVVGVTVREGDNINLNDLMEVPRLRVHGAEDLQRFEDVILDKPLPKLTTAGPEQKPFPKPPKGI